MGTNPRSPLAADPNERGASAVEYALIVAAIAAMIALVAVLLGGLTLELFQSSCETVASETGGTCEE